ncbi:unnamed protein product [Plutella xylostella]|uniref:(diamondback moth) hypothetical protein n=1 Tax=Plutella xylostella TaxID=51655 RepID=A0A8S4GCT0_PLUXY|nr:unnamed protein product [Plutella xylostella]
MAAEGRTKKVVIHVPYKVKKIKHTHTVYKTVHHHHTHREPPEPLHLGAPSEEHEHFHHMHLHDEGSPSMPIPDFLPDVPLDVPDIPDMVELPGHRHIPLFRRVSHANVAELYPDEDDEDYSVEDDGQSEEKKP